MSTLLASMLHISDLHLGIFNPATGDAEMSALDVFALKHLPKADGLFSRSRATTTTGPAASSPSAPRPPSTTSTSPTTFPALANCR